MKILLVGLTLKKKKITTSELERAHPYRRVHLVNRVLLTGCSCLKICVSEVGSRLSGKQYSILLVMSALVQKATCQRSLFNGLLTFNLPIPLAASNLLPQYSCQSDLPNTDTITLISPFNILHQQDKMQSPS